MLGFERRPSVSNTLLAFSTCTQKLRALCSMIPGTQSVWLTAREAALYVRVSHRTILEWAKTGRIPAHRLSGTDRITWRFPC